MRYLILMLFFLQILSSCSPLTERIKDYDVHGIDISHHQSAINWDTVAAQDIAFAFVKATEGESHGDSLYCHNWAAMKRIGIKRGAYHFYRPSKPAELQARNFIELVKMEYGDLPPVLDVEVLDGIPKYSLINGIRTWLFTVEIHYNIKPIIYTNIKFYNKYLAGHFNDFPVWIARYNSKPPRLADNKKWYFWQYGNQGRLNGISGNVDFNVFNGSLTELEELCLAPKAVLSDNSSSD